MKWLTFLNRLTLTISWYAYDLSMHGAGYANACLLGTGTGDCYESTLEGVLATLVTRALAVFIVGWIVDNLSS